MPGNLSTIPTVAVVSVIRQKEFHSSPGEPKLKAQNNLWRFHTPQSGVLLCIKEGCGPVCSALIEIVEGRRGKR